MDDQHVQPFSALPGRQFSDLRRPTVYQVPPRYNFSGFRESRPLEATSIPTAPRFGEQYQQPLIQWPPVRTDAPMPPPSAGTFDNLRITEPTAQLPPPYTTQPHQQNPAFLPGPVFSRQPSMVHRQLSHLQPAQQSYPVAQTQEVQRQLQQEIQRHQTYRYPQSDSSVDAVQICAMDYEPRQTFKIPLLPEMPVPNPLTIKQKIKAFFGNDKLLSRHAHRQASKQRYKRL